MINALAANGYPDTEHPLYPGPAARTAADCSGNKNPAA